jgi:hypothetical protein
VRRLHETTGQTVVEWLVVMVAVGALAVVLVGALPATAPAIVDRFGCLIRTVTGSGDCGATSGSSDAAPLPAFGDGPPIVHIGDGSDWVPQGLGYDPATDRLLTTYYPSPDGDPDRDAGILLSRTAPPATRFSARCSPAPTTAGVWPSTVTTSG